jgi:hypothetical protein
MLRGKFNWRAHEKGRTEKVMNLEKHQNADGFSGKRN